MLARLRKSAENKDSGFTLIELLVVMIIIGILAAIAIPAFLNQKKKARETAAKADVTTIGKEIAAYYVDGTGALNVTSTTGAWAMKTGATAGSGTAVADGRLSTGNAVVAYKIDSDTVYCVAVQNTATGGGDAWSYTQAGLQKGEVCP